VPSLALLTDFGSTYTKVCAVDTESGQLIGRGKAPSTVDTDVIYGWNEAVNILNREYGVALSELSAHLACSSAGGGLRMVVVGFVPRLTSKAGEMAALGAGAKLVGRYSYRLTDAQVEEIRNAAPDILLLCGGTDGGDTETVLHNAKKLATHGPNSAVVYAGNQDASDEVGKIFRAAAKDVKATENVMPEVGDVNTRGISDLVRQIFADHVIKAKGIDRVKELTGSIVMPTPAAVYTGLDLLSRGYNDNRGLGDLLAVDVGGATTDAYSFCYGRPTRPDVILRGLREPYGKRTVEGDVGVRINAASLVAAAQANGIEINQLNDNESFKILVSNLPSCRTWLPSTDAEQELDASLASSAIAIAVRRHAGRLSEIYAADGMRWIQEGKDLSDITWCVGTGGPLVYNAASISILEDGLRLSRLDPLILAPRQCHLLLDRFYCMYAVGLLRHINPQAAFQLACYSTGLAGDMREIVEIQTA
jgi:uncharacterized protein (TIGR01319 family)